MFLLTKNRCRFFQLLYLESGFLSVAYLTIANLTRLVILVHYQVSVMSQYLVRLSSGAGLQVVTQSTHLPKHCYPQLKPNPHRSEIQPSKQLEYRCMPLHYATQCFAQVNAGQDTQTDIAYVHLVFLILIVIGLLFHTSLHQCEIKNKDTQEIFLENLMMILIMKFLKKDRLSPSLKV